MRGVTWKTLLLNYLRGRLRLFSEHSGAVPWIPVYDRLAADLYSYLGSRQCKGGGMQPIGKSKKLHNVCYDIRGPVLEQARLMEDEGHHIIKLNIGNLAQFGFEPPEEIQQDMIRNLPQAAGYSDSKGIFSAPKAVMH
jgi:hypothetical protein